MNNKLSHLRHIQLVLLALHPSFGFTKRNSMIINIRRSGFELKNKENNNHTFLTQKSFKVLRTLLSSLKGLS